MEADPLIVLKFFKDEILKKVGWDGKRQRFVERTVKRLRETGSVTDRPRSGRPRTARTKERIKRIREKIRRDPCRSGRKMAKEEETSEPSMPRIIRRHLRFKPYKKCKRHGLSEVQKGERVKRAKALSKRHHADGVKKIAFSDEKLCMTEQGSK